MMKIAILILAHKNPEQLKILIDQLKQDFEVFVHIDKKASFFSEFSDEKHVHIIKKRYNTYWGSFQITEATLELFRASCDHKCDFYLLISGQDLPTKSNREIIGYFTDHPFDHLSYFLLPSPDWSYNGGLDRLHLWWETKFESNTGKLLPVLFFYKAFFFLLRKAQTVFNIKRKLPFACYGGAQWLNLTSEAVKFILTFTNENRWYSHRFRYTRCSDEIFFQTLLLSFNYSGKNNIINDSKRYVDWSSGPEYPRTLTIDDYEKIVDSDAIFARKFDENKDNLIIERLIEIDTS